jgi:hypothetical protein
VRAALDERRAPAVGIVDDLIGNGERARAEIGPDAANRRNRHHVRHAARMERPDVRAIVHFVRGNGMPRTMARQEHDVAAAERSKDERPGGPAIRRAHGRAALDRHGFEFTQAAAADDA